MNQFQTQSLFFDITNKNVQSKPQLNGLQEVKDFVNDSSVFCRQCSTANFDLVSSGCIASHFRRTVDALLQRNRLHRTHLLSNLIRSLLVTSPTPILLRFLPQETISNYHQVFQLLTLFLTVVELPAFSNISMSFSCPILAAICRGVLPSWLKKGITITTNDFLLSSSSISCHRMQYSTN